MLQRILIVDDDPDVHRLLGVALEDPDRQIDNAYDGLAGLRCAENTAYDLVLTDLNMPGLDGLSLLDRIHQIQPEARVVVMTVDNTPETVLRSLRERAYSFFSKPFTITAVGEMVERALRTIPGKDDIEVLSASPHWLGLQLRCKIETADRILQFLREMGMDLPPAEQENIGIAFREILLNAIEHGGKSDPNQKVTITYVRTGRVLLYYVRDPGKGFSLDKLEHAAVANPEESPFGHVQVRQRLGLRPGGFGILMTRELVDEVIYNEAGNEVVLLKYLDRVGPGFQPAAGLPPGVL